MFIHTFVLPGCIYNTLLAASKIYKRQVVRFFHPAKTNYFCIEKTLQTCPSLCGFLVLFSSPVLWLPRQQQFQWATFTNVDRQVVSCHATILFVLSCLVSSPTATPAVNTLSGHHGKSYSIAFQQPPTTVLARNTMFNSEPDRSFPLLETGRTVTTSMKPNESVRELLYNL